MLKDANNVNNASNGHCALYASKQCTQSPQIHFRPYKCFKLHILINVDNYH